MPGDRDMKTEDSDPQGAFDTPLLAKQDEMSTSSAIQVINNSSKPSANSTELAQIKTQPKTLSDMENSNDLVCINLSGKKYYILLKNFTRFPSSRLSTMMRCTEKEEIEEYCDMYTPGDIPEYFYDRSWKGFNDVLDVYRLGSLHISSSGFCPMRFRSQLEYWKIDDLLLDACCAVKYYPELEICEKEIVSQTETEEKYLARITEEDFGDTKLGKLRKYLWNLTEYPETSTAAQICAFSSIAVVVISTITFVLSTLPELTDNIDIMLFENETSSDGQPATPIVRWDEGILALKITDDLTMVFFTVEYLVRFICSPKKWPFFKAPLNLIDLLAILPYFLGFAIESIKDTQVIGRAGKVLRLIRVMRILRVFKLVRHFSGLQSLLSTLKEAYKELGLLMILLWVSVLTVSSLIYFAEKDAIEKWSFYDSFWWGLMVLTTVGYGAVAPTTAVGKIIGGFCALLGVFILALPVPIVVNSFTSNHKNRHWKEEVMLLKQDRLEEKKEKGDVMCSNDGKVNGLVNKNTETA